MDRCRLKQKPPVRMLLWLSRETPAVNARTNQNRPPCGGASHRGLRRMAQCVGGRTEVTLVIGHWPAIRFLLQLELPLHARLGFFTFTAPHPAPASPSRMPFSSLTDTPCHSIPFRPSLLRKAVSKDTIVCTHLPLYSWNRSHLGKHHIGHIFKKITAELAGCREELTKDKDARTPPQDALIEWSIFVKG